MERQTPEQREALETILQGGVPDNPDQIRVPESYNAGGRAYEDPDEDEDGIYEHRPTNAEVGDKWRDESGDLWEMGRGGPMKVSSLDQVRTPLFCPECGNIMGDLDQTFYYKRGKCMDCVQKFETKLKVEGLYELYEKLTILRNKESWLRDIKQGLEDFRNQMDANHDVTESGRIIEWNKVSEDQKDEMFQNAEEFIEEFEQHLEASREEVERLREEAEDEGKDLSLIQS